MVSDAASVLTSSARNCTQALVMTEPAGTGTPAKRVPTVCTLVPSVTSSRSELVSETDPLEDCSASSDPAAQQGFAKL